jgi:hypothetical protein
MSNTTTAGVPVFIVGDVHGQCDVLKRVLRDAGLIDLSDRWSGADATLWFTGDFCDRGPQGVPAIDLVMRLQSEAAAAGGAVKALLGNHDVLILAAREFGRADTEQTRDWGDQFTSDWLINGGWLPDLHAMTERHVRWLSRLPALAMLGRSTLLAHADAIFYLDYGRTMRDVNQGIAHVLACDTGRSWERLLNQFCERRAFGPANGPDEGRRLDLMLGTFGAQRLVHGHTPIPLVSGRPADQVTGPLVYADGRCINVDAGLFLGAHGFVFEVPGDWVS